MERLLVNALAMRVSRLTDHVVEALHEPVEVRVARPPRSLAETYRTDHGAISVPMTQEDLASLAGTTRPTANRALRDLETDGAVAITRGRIEITDSPLWSDTAAHHWSSSTSAKTSMPGTR